MSRLSDEARRNIRQAFGKTASIRAAARQVGVSRNAVRRELKRLVTVRAPKSIPRKSKLDPYKAKIGYLVREKHLSAVRVLEEITELGYQGGYSIVKDYIRTIRTKPRKRPTPPIDHAPGHEGQMDWSPHRVMIGGRQQVVHTGSIVLCFSRWIYVRHFSDETIESVIRLHEEAFHELGAVPEIMTYDNMTTVGRHTGKSKVWINPTFKRFADEYGFKIVILPPGAKDRHGAVERPFHYIEHNFLAGREFESMEALNQQADHWRAKVANVRVHGTLRQRPVDRLQRERPYLLPLPQNKIQGFYREVTRLIHTDFCVAIDTNRYSASPHLIGSQACVRLYQEHLEIWVDDKCDCKHVYCKQRFKREVLPEHEAIYKKITGQHQLLKDAFMRLGEPATAYYEGLRKQRRAAAGYHLQRILKFADRYGSDVVAGALAYAMRYGAYSADSVIRIIHGKALKQKGRALLKNVPENIKDWLRSCAVQDHDLGFYDKFIEGTETDDKEEKS